MIEPARFLRAMANPAADILHLNASAIIVEYLDRMNYPVDALLNVPIAALQGGPMEVGGAIDSVQMRINVEGNVLKPIVQDVRSGPIQTAAGQGAYCIINESVILTMTHAGDAVAVLIAAYGEPAIVQVDAPRPHAPRRISVRLRNLLWQLLPGWFRRRLRDR